MQYRKMIVVGGLSLVVGALAFVFVFAYLAANFGFFGEIALAAFFLLAGSSMLDEPRFPKWLGWCGIVFALLFFVGAFRNVTSAVQPVADADNVLLPLWMVILGTAFVWYARLPHPTRPR